MKDLIKYRTCVANVNYHIIFCVKYRHKVLNDTIADFLKKTILDIATEKDFTIKAMEIGESDHIHLFVSAHPKHSIGQIVKWIKGISGIKLFKTFIMERTTMVAQLLCRNHRLYQRKKYKKIYRKSKYTTFIS